MPKFEIKHRWNGSVLFSIEIGSLKLAVEAAVIGRADLRRADLSSAKGINRILARHFVFLRGHCISSHLKHEVTMGPPLRRLWE